MTIFDSHAHFPIEAQAMHDAQIARAREAGLWGVLAVGGSPHLDSGAVELARKYPDFVYLAEGYDRDLAMEVAESELCLADAMARLVDKLGGYVAEGLTLRAIGEIGLDYSRNPSAEEMTAQKRVFEEQLKIADLLRLPCSIHSRDATADMLEILARSGSKKLAAEGRLGVIHCFTGDAEFAATALDLGLMIGVSGIVTFNNADPLRRVVEKLPRDRVIVETDCPYLTPVPKRGQTNEPALMVHTVEKLAAIWTITAEECGELTSANVRRLLKI